MLQTLHKRALREGREESRGRAAPGRVPGAPGGSDGQVDVLRGGLAATARLSSVDSSPKTLRSHYFGPAVMAQP